MNTFQSFSLRFLQRIPLQEKINFIRHLAIIIRAGVPVFEGLKIIQKQTTSKALKAVIDHLIVDVNNGKFLADSLARFPHFFNDFIVNIIRVGESSGTLGKNLTYLADEMDKSRDLRAKIRSALVYPIIVLTMTVVIVSVLIFFVFPKIVPVLLSLNVKLPITTRILIWTSDFLLHYGLVLLGGCIVGSVLIRFCVKRIFPIRYAVHRSLFLIPIMSGLTKNIGMANFSRVLAILLKSGTKIVEAILITGKTFENVVYRRAFEDVADRIRKGEELSQALSAQAHIFPPLLVGLIGIGESTGNLEENLEYLGEYYTKETDIKLKDLTTVLEPILLLIMGFTVGFVAISIITPIYQISSGFSK